MKLVILLFLLVSITNCKTNPTKYYDLVLRKCMQGGFSKCPNCNTSISWSISYVSVMTQWTKPINSSNCNMNKIKGINETVISNRVKDIRNELDEHWYVCGDCSNGTCAPYNSIGWFQVWDTFGICSDWNVLEYFINGLLMYSKLPKYYYGCCYDQIRECHIPHDHNLKFMGCYWPASKQSW